MNIYAVKWTEVSIGTLFVMAAFMLNTVQQNIKAKLWHCDIKQVNAVHLRSNTVS